MATGVALMFGIALPQNFHSPYKSRNIAEFWRRWHITLGRFLTQCIYIPLGGSRGGARASNSNLAGSGGQNGGAGGANSNLAGANGGNINNPLTKILTLRNIFIVFFISGVWHGAGWGFVVWGVLHAAAMMAQRAWSWAREALCERAPGGAWARFVGGWFYAGVCWAATFAFVNVAWVFFRAKTLGDALALLKVMFGVECAALPRRWFSPGEVFAHIGGSKEMLAYFAAAALVVFVFKNSFEWMNGLKVKNTTQPAKSPRAKFEFGGLLPQFLATILLFWASVWVLAIAHFAGGGYSPFIYFNF